MKTIDLKKRSIFLGVIAGKCPHCGEGQIFKKSAGLFKMPVMHDECPACRYKFEREPGYFLGAMYVSYGIVVFAGIITFLLLHFLAPALPTIYIPLTMIAVIVAISKKNFKLSRAIYMYMFPW
jgi:uncharacterized protein (DUF983 family)